MAVVGLEEISPPHLRMPASKSIRPRRLLPERFDDLDAAGELAEVRE